MKMTVNGEILGEGKYNAPEIEMYAMPVEGGFGRLSKGDPEDPDIMDDGDNWNF